MVGYVRSSKLAAAFAGAACLLFAGLAHAQTSNPGAVALVRANNQRVMQSYGALRDASGAPVSTDGAIETGEDRSGLSNAGVDGAGDMIAGVGAEGGAGIFGGGLNVVTAAPPGAAAPATATNIQTSSGGGVVGPLPSGGLTHVDQYN